MKQTLVLLKGMFLLWGKQQDIPEGHKTDLNVKVCQAPAQEEAKAQRGRSSPALQKSKTNSCKMPTVISVKADSDIHMQGRKRKKHSETARRKVKRKQE